MIVNTIMRVLGIDQSYRSCGIVILEDGKMIFCERYVTDPEKDVYDRAHQLATHIQLLALKHLPDKIALEGLSFGSTGNVTRDLGGLLFTIIVYLRRDGRNAMVIAPPTVKKVATGKGNVKKEEVIEALPTEVRNEFDAIGVKKTTGLSDLADAYWVAKAAEAM